MKHLLLSLTILSLIAQPAAAQCFNQFGRSFCAPRVFRSYSAPIVHKVQKQIVEYAQPYAVEKKVYNQQFFYGVGQPAGLGYQPLQASIVGQAERSIQRGIDQLTELKEYQQQYQSQQTTVQSYAPPIQQYAPPQQYAPQPQYQQPQYAPPTCQTCAQAQQQYYQQPAYAPPGYPQQQPNGYHQQPPDQQWQPQTQPQPGQWPQQQVPPPPVEEGYAQQHPAHNASVARFQAGAPVLQQMPGPVTTARCVQCHNGPNAKGGFELAHLREMTPEERLDVFKLVRSGRMPKDQPRLNNIELGLLFNEFFAPHEAGQVMQRQTKQPPAGQQAIAAGFKPQWNGPTQ